MTCPRCGGHAAHVELLTEEEAIEAERCMNCGWLFGEPLLDRHHALTDPPDPRPDVLTPIYDQTHRRLIQRIVNALNEPAD